ncbi:hypothetical protein H5410_056206 [Solanum commersonii]|uniref:Ribosomal protein L23 n=1 Tax=Solanum commersonii TaxID=4109 RepID=A0A9J5WM13_SOLCO|nr:hypothetical protein H5410_056206 [Solanum commersonii]
MFESPSSSERMMDSLNEIDPVAFYTSFLSPSPTKMSTIYPVDIPESFPPTLESPLDLNVTSIAPGTEIKHWVELFFGVKVMAMNSHRLSGKSRRMGPIMGHTMHYRRMIITLQPGYSIPPLRKTSSGQDD